MLLYNSQLRLLHGKIKLKLSDLFKAMWVVTNKDIELEGKEGLTFKVNGQHLKLYLESAMRFNLLKRCILKMFEGISMSSHMLSKALHRIQSKL